MSDKLRSQVDDLRRLLDGLIDAGNDLAREAQQGVIQLGSASWADRMRVAANRWDSAVAAVADAELATILFDADVPMTKTIAVVQSDVEPGQPGFLWSWSWPGGRRPEWALADRPRSMNQSLAPLLWGWLGTTNDVCDDAHGLAVRVADRGGRIMVRPLRRGSDEEAEALASLGYETWGEGCRLLRRKEVPK